MNKNTVNKDVETSSDFKRLVSLQAATSDASNRLEALLAEVNANFLSLLDDAKGDFADLQELVTDAEAQMEALARSHPEWFLDKKSVKTPFGTVKFHRSTVLEVRNEEVSVVLIEVAAEAERNALKEPLALEGLVKTVKVLNLEALELLDDATLAQFRISRRDKENFSVVPAKVDMGKAVKTANEKAEALAV